jgi:hypothetical protein
VRAFLPRMLSFKRSLIIEMSSSTLDNDADTNGDWFSHQGLSSQARTRGAECTWHQRKCRLSQLGYEEGGRQPYVCHGSDYIAMLWGICQLSLHIWGSHASAHGVWSSRTNGKLRQKQNPTTIVSCNIGL